MAQVASPVTVPFKADVGGFLGGMKQASGALGSFGVAAQKVGINLKGMGAAVAVATTALAGLKVAKESVETFKKFETAMTRVQAVSRANAGEMEKLESQTAKVAAQTTFTASEVAEGMGFMAMAGMEVSTIIESVADAANLAQAAQIGMAEASDIVTNIMKSMGLEASQVTEAVDLLVATQARANVTVRMLGEGMKYVGPLAKNAGMTLSEVSAAMGNLGNAGIQASMAGTTMRQALQNMMNPAKRAREAMTELGISFVTSEGKLRPFVDILRDLENASMSTEQILKMFGVRAGPGMAALISQGADSFEKLHDDIQQVGAAADISAAVMGTLAGKENQLAAATENLEKKIGKALTPTIKDLVDDLRFAVEGLADLNSKFFQSKTGILAATGAIIALAGAFAFIPWAAIGAAITGIGSALGVMGGLAVGAAVSLAAFLGIADSDGAEQARRQKEEIEGQVGALKKKAEITKEINQLAAKFESGGNQSGGVDKFGFMGANIKQWDALVEAAKEYSVVIPESVKNTLGLTDAVNRQDSAASAAAKAVEDLANETKNVGSNAKQTARQFKSMASTFQTTQSQQGIAQIEANMLGLGITSDVDSEQVGLDQQVSNMMAENALSEEAFSDDVEEMAVSAKKASTGMRDAAMAVEGVGAFLAGQNLGSLIGSFFGPLGGAIGGVVDMISQFSPSFGKFLGRILNLSVILGKVLDPLFNAFGPLLAMIGATLNALAPALTVLIELAASLVAAQLTYQIVAFLAVLTALGMGFSWLLLRLDEFLDGLPGDWGFLSNAEAQEIEDNIESSLGFLENIPALLNPLSDAELRAQAIEGGSVDLGDWSNAGDDTERNLNGLGSAANSAATSINRMTESVLNAPSGFKLAGYAFDASDGVAPTTSGEGGGTTIININEINDPDTVRTMLEESQSRRNYGGGGTPLPY